MRNFIWLCIFFLLCSCEKMREESTVKNVCENFLKGRIAYNQGDETMLKEATSDTLFLVIELNKEHAKVLRAGGAQGINEDIKRIKITNVNLEDDCAVCNTNRNEYYFINLCKDDNGKWKVQGENNKYPSAAQIHLTKNEIQKQKEYLVKKSVIDSVLKVVNSFHKAVKTYFLTDDINILSETCNSATFKAVKSLYYYTKKINRLEELKEEIKFPKALAMDPLFEGESVKSKFYKEEIFVNLKKIDNHYTIVGLNNINSDKITTNTIHQNYLDLLRALYLLRTKTYWKNMKFMAVSR